MHIAQPLLPALESQLTQCAPTFADLLEQVAGWEDLAETRRRDLASGLRRAARILGLPIGAIPTDPAWLSEHLFDRAPAAHGLTVASFSNVTSLVRAALRRIACHAPKRLPESSLTEGWATLLAEVQAAGQRGCLERLARFAETRGIAPSSMSDAILAEYVAEHRRSQMRAKPQDFRRTVALAWNAIGRAKPSLALPSLTVGEGRLRYALRLETLPLPFQQDVERFRQRLGQGGSTGRFLLSPEGPRHKLAARTIETRVFNIRQAVGILGLLGHDIASMASLRDLIEPLERPGAILDWLHARRTEREGEDRAQCGGQLLQMAETLRQVARHHVKADEKTCAALATWCQQAQPPRRSSMTSENRDRLRHITQPRPYAMLINLPEELFRRARRQGSSPKEQARLAMLAVALEILLVFPVRKATLMALRLDQHLQRLGAKGRELTHFVIPAQDVKNREALEWPIPKESARLIDEYIRRFRPHLAEPSNPFLFPSHDGEGVRSHAALATSLVGIIEAETGCWVNLHLLRHLAAWTFLRHNPGAYEDVRRVLGHRDLATTVSFYTGFEAAAAAERFDATILRERKATRLTARLAWGSAAARPGQPGKRKR